MFNWDSLVQWDGYGLVGVVLSFASFLSALAAYIRAKSASEQAHLAVSLFSAFDGVEVLGATMESLRGARHSIRSKDWRRVSENIEDAEIRVVRLLASEKKILDQDRKRKLEEILETIRTLASDADAAEERGMSMDALQSKQRIKIAINSLVSIQEWLKGTHPQ